MLLAIAAVVFLGAYALPILQTELAESWVSVCRWATWLVWVLFALDYFIRVKLSENRCRFIKKHLFDLAILALPLLRPLRLLRLVALLSIFNRSAKTSLRGRVVVYITGGSFLLTFVAALAILDVERNLPDGNIKDFADALWWAITTVTTVGYGDRFPTSDYGRLIGAALMVAGIALLGTVTATLASWLVQAIAAEEHGTQEDLRSLAREVKALREQLLAQDGTLKP